MTRTKGEQVRGFATDTLADYLSNDADGLFDLFADANEKQFGPMYGKLVTHQERAIALGNAEVAKAPVEDSTEADKETLAMRQANAAVMLLRIEAANQVWPLLKHSPDPRVRSYIIHWLSPRGGKSSSIIARYEQETDVTIKRALLLCLGEFELAHAEQQPLLEKLLDVYRTDPDAGLHAAAEWLLRKWGQGKKIAAIDEELQQNEEQLTADKDNNRQWYVNSQGQTFMILDAGEFQMGSPESSQNANEVLHRRKIGRRIAMSTKEVTRTHWRAFAKSQKGKVWAADKDQHKAYVLTDDSPMLGVTWYEAAWYCNWLSEQEGIPKDQWIYESNDKGEYGPGMKAKENFLELTGYRLATEGEWEFTCRAGASTSRYYGQTETLLRNYAWYQPNSDSHAHAVASLKPNDFGLFDLQGNAREWCYDLYDSYAVDSEGSVADAPAAGTIPVTVRPTVRGGAFAYPPEDVRSAYRNDTDQPDFRFRFNGFRPSRTYNLSL